MWTISVSAAGSAPRMSHRKEAAGNSALRDLAVGGTAEKRPALAGQKNVLNSTSPLRGSGLFVWRGCLHAASDIDEIDLPLGTRLQSEHHEQLSVDRLEDLHDRLAATAVRNGWGV